jgi:hypothetical protein
VVVVLVVVLLGGGGFYYAGQIESEALAVRHPEPLYEELVVDSSTDGQVVLHRTGGDVTPDPLRTDGVYGLVWAGGRGVISGPPTPGVGGRITRVLQVTAGTAPAAGTRAGLDRDVWTDPRAAYGAAFQDVTYPCAGGSCPAWFVPGTGTTWMVLVHGKNSTRTEPLRALSAALRAGLPALDIAYRNDVGAPADPSGRHQYGATEWRDLEQAVDYATTHGAQHVVLFGASMGGSIVASFLQHSRSASLVRGVVLDAPALDLRSAVEFGASQRRLPLLGSPIPGVLTATAEWIAGRRYSLDWNRIDYLRGDWLDVPALVFQGTLDDTVPAATSDRFAAAHPGLVSEVRVPGASHVESWNVDPAAYEAREAAFLGCVTAAEASSCAAG